jgi:hypothetical protein
MDNVPHTNKESGDGWEGRDGYLNGASNFGGQKRAEPEAKPKDKANQTSSTGQTTGKRYYCHQCKGPVTLNQIFCIRCGTKLKW